jgi:hypothetical protein
VKVALNVVADDTAFGQRARSMCAGVIGDKKLAVKVEYGQ